MSEEKQSRIELLESNPRKKKLIFGSLISLLIIIFLAGIAWGINDVLLTEGTMEIPPATPVFASPSPNNANTAIKKLDELLNKVKQDDAENKVKLKTETSYNLDGDSITDNTDNGSFDTIVKFIKDDVLSKIHESSYNAEFGFKDSFSSSLISPNFTSDSIKEFSLISPEENPENQILSFVFNEQELKNDKNDILYKNFNLNYSLASFNTIKESCSAFCSVQSSSIICRDFEIKAEYNAVTNTVTNIKYNRNYYITLTLDFFGELKEIGTKTISFKLSATEEYIFTYAGITIEERVLWLEKGNTDNVKYIKTTDENVSVNWKSSNEAIATVDNEGYIKAIKTSETPVYITASIEYLQNTYEEVLTVYVRKPVKEIKLNTKTLSIAVGETAVLNVSFSPDNATVKQLIWLTDNNNIAEVDSNGIVTAKGCGEVKIYAVSLDGSYKSACTVTVKEANNNG